MRTDEAPDEYVDELESDEWADPDEAREGMDDFARAMSIVYGANWLFANGVITARTYFEAIDAVEEQFSDVPMP